MTPGLAEGAVRKASEAEDEARQARDEKDVLATHLELAQQQLSDLEALRKGTSKQQAVAARLVALSEEVRTHKLATLQQRREIHILRQEKKHLPGDSSNRHYRTLRQPNHTLIAPQHNLT